MKYCHRGGRKGCHGNDPKMMQRHHIGSGNSLRDRCKRKGGVSERNKMKGGVIPLPGSHESATRQPRNMTKGRNGHEAHKGDISYNTSKHSRVTSRGYTFEACVSGRFET